MVRTTRIVVIACIVGFAFVALLVVAAQRSRQPQIMTREQAHRRTQELKQGLALPIDESTRQKVYNLTNDLAREHEYISVSGKKYSLSTKACWDLREIGEAAIPQLVDTAASHTSGNARQSALALIYDLTKTQDMRPLKYLPVFAQSMYDKDPKVRGTALAQIREMARRFHRNHQQKELDQVMPYLIKALGDNDEGVRHVAGDGLFRLGRKDLVPQELIEKYEMEIWR